MDKTPEFKYIPEASADITQTCPIQIVSGEFAGIVYRYGKISFNETPSGELDINMEISLITAPDEFVKENVKFTNTVGKIFMKIIEDRVDSEPIDLEADVHEDPVDNS